MPPQDFQSIAAKILFFVFATCLLCMGRVQGKTSQEMKNTAVSTASTHLFK